MKAIKSQDFLASLTAQKAAAGYLIIGSDGYIVDKVYQGIRDIIKRKMPRFETLNLYGDELTVSELSEYLDSYSIFAEERLLILRNAHRLGEENKNRKQPERQKIILNQIGKYLANPEPTQIIILVAEAADGRITEWKRIKEACQVIECEPIKYGGEMRAWLETTLRRNQKTMESRAKELFLEKVELDYSTADNEMQKLFILVGDRKNITEKDINITLPSTRLGTMADFFRALGNRQCAQVTAKVLDMMENEWVDLQILSVLFKFFLNLWKIQALRAKHITPQEIIAKHLKDLFENQRKEYVAYADKYSPKELVNIFEIILETDSQIKLSMAESEVLMTICVARICNGK